MLDGELNFGPSEVMDLKGTITLGQNGSPPHVDIMGQERPCAPVLRLRRLPDGTLAEWSESSSRNYGLVDPGPKDRSRATLPLKLKGRNASLRLRQ